MSVLRAMKPSLVSVNLLWCLRNDVECFITFIDEYCYHDSELSIDLVRDGQFASLGNDMDRIINVKFLDNYADRCPHPVLLSPTLYPLCERQSPTFQETFTWPAGKPRQ